MVGFEKEAEAYLDECARAMRDDEAGAPTECAHILSRLIDDGVHRRALNGFAASKCGNMSFEGDDVRGIETSGRFLVLAETADVQLSVVRQMNITSHIYSSPNVFVQAKVSPGAIGVTSYTLPVGFREEALDAKVVLEPDWTSNIVDETPLVKRFNSVLDVHAIETPPLIFVRLSFFPRGNYEWSFDRATLRPVGHTTLRLPETNLCGILDLLAMAGNGETIDLIEPLAFHELHFLRWRAVQAVGALDAERGFRLVQRAVDDPHPAVREAARRTLATAAG
ncbi:HEAT repeat domain-containing protein [Sphingomonas zeae]